MSVESEILRIQHNIANAYAAVSEKGGDVPLQPTSANLPAAINTIPGSGGGGVPKGTIVIWSGTANDIPSGWALCDGQDGRPDLRDKFVLGAGGKYNVGATGGAEEVTLTAEQMPAHTHTYNRGSMSGKQSFGQTGGLYDVRWGNDNLYYTSVSGSSQPHPNMPPTTLCVTLSRPRKTAAAALPWVKWTRRFRRRWGLTAPWKHIPTKKSVSALGSTGSRCIGKFTPGPQAHLAKLKI